MAKTGAGRKLGRRGHFRTSLLRSLTTDLLRYERIKTTFAKAKECSRFTDRIISAAKKDDLVSRRKVGRDIQDQEVLKKIFDVLIKRYEKRTGSCTRIFRLAARQGDNAPVALIKLIA